ncbi:MAG TPA: alanine--tRNA ligase, partial [Candidatus Bathyarchaeota archaeon]|nr:alanine--tRNA ligase [Candidatus Bathyarchaeota archaeon]
LAVAEEIVEINGVKLVKRKFSDINIERMIQTASQTVKKEPNAVVLFYASDNKTARIVVMAGKEAIEKGADAGEIAKVAASIVGGGGGGRPDFAQGGGTKPENLEKAIKEAEKTLEKQLKD